MANQSYHVSLKTYVARLFVTTNPASAYQRGYSSRSLSRPCGTEAAGGYKRCEMVVDCGKNFPLSALLHEGRPPRVLPLGGSQVAAIHGQRGAGDTRRVLTGKKQNGFGNVQWRQSDPHGYAL